MALLTIGSHVLHQSVAAISWGSAEVESLCLMTASGYAGAFLRMSVIEHDVTHFLRYLSLLELCPAASTSYGKVKVKPFASCPPPEEHYPSLGSVIEHHGIALLTNNANSTVSTRWESFLYAWAPTQPTGGYRGERRGNESAWPVSHQHRLVLSGALKWVARIRLEGGSARFGIAPLFGTHATDSGGARSGHRTVRQSHPSRRSVVATHLAASITLTGLLISRHKAMRWARRCLLKG